MTVNCISFALYFQQFSLLKAIPRDSERSNNDVFELNILTNFNLIWYFRWYGTNKLQSIHFVFFVCARIHLTVLLFGCFITLCFLSYSVFPPFWVGSLRSQTLDSWFCVEQEVQVPKKCTRVWAKRPLFWINLGFPKIVRSRTIFLCIAPPQGGTCILPCVGAGPRMTHVQTPCVVRGPAPTHGQRRVSA